MQTQTAQANTLLPDLTASFVVFLVALPLCLGIALASGAPLFAGIVSGVIGGVIIGSLSGSALGVSGPAAGLTVIVLGGISTLGWQPFLLATLIAGGIQIIAGIVRLGTLSYFFPSSVIKGMLSAIGVIIIIKQLPHALGIAGVPNLFHAGLGEALKKNTPWHSGDSTHWCRVIFSSSQAARHKVTLWRAFATIADRGACRHRPRGAFSRSFCALARPGVTICEGAGHRNTEKICWPT
jgi:MFS superfamily sulfate permease-like transporter